MKLKTFTRRAAAAGAVLAALTLAALPALAAPKVQVDTTNAVADHADILSDETEQYVNDVSIKLSDACGAQIGVYTLDELLGSTTMEGFAYDVFNAWGLGSDDLDNGVLLLLAPNEADGGDYYIMRGDGLESQLSFSTLGSLLDEYMEPYWVNGDYDTGTQKTVQALANRLCSIYGVTLNSSYTDTSAPDKGGPNVMGFVLLVVAVLGAGAVPAACGALLGKKPESLMAMAAGSLACAFVGAVSYRCIMWLITVPIANLFLNVL